MGSLLLLYQPCQELTTVSAAPLSRTCQLREGTKNRTLLLQPQSYRQLCPLRAKRLILSRKSRKGLLRPDRRRGCLPHQTFSPRELVARIKALLHRSRQVGGVTLPQATLPDIPPARQRWDALTIDEAQHEVMLQGHPVDLTAREFALLLAFAQHPGRVFTRDQLLERVWGDAYYDNPGGLCPPAGKGDHGWIDVNTYDRSLRTDPFGEHKSDLADAGANIQHLHPWGNVGGLQEGAGEAVKNSDWRFSRLASSGACANR